MNARSWTSWCSAAMLAGTALAADGTNGPAKSPAGGSINYNLADSNLPMPPLLKTVKPLTPAPTPAPKAEVAAAPKPAPMAQAPKPAAAKAEPPLPLLVPEPSPMKASVVEAAVARPMITPVAAYLPDTDEHVKCVECLKTLSGSPIESDRKAALAELGKLHAWKRMKTAYMLLRRVALTEYNTAMRADAVKLLGQSLMEHALAADTLKLSAQYDSDAVIRATAMAQLEKLASTPPDRVIR